MILTADLFTAMIVMGIVGGVAIFAAWVAFLILDQQVELTEAERTKTELESLLKEAKFLQLSAQIQPHFLFNTLNVIDSLIRLGKMEEAHEATRALSFLLRYRLNDLNRMVTVEDEMNYVLNYLTIQKLRFGPRLELVVDIEKGINERLIPPLTIQPLVENACIHGIEPHLEGGEIWIQGRLVEKGFEIDVIDNGVGFSAKRYDEIANWLDSNEPSETNEGIALRNVNQRLRYLFGEGSGLTINSSLMIGTHCKMTIHLPRSD